MSSGDDDLLAGLRAGDESAFTALYRRWQGPIYRYALRMSGLPALAEDVTQDVFVVMLRRDHGYDPARGPLGAYLHGIARHMVRRRLQHERARLPIAEGSTTDDPLAGVSRRESRDRVWEAVLRLPLPFREAVVLCDLQGLSYVEAACALGCAVGTVRSRLHRGRGHLREFLAVNRPGLAPEARTQCG